MRSLMILLKLWEVLIWKSTHGSRQCMARMTRWVCSTVVLILGLALGMVLGYWLGQEIIDVLMGAGVGLFVGVSMGLVSHAIISLKRK